MCILIIILSALYIQGILDKHLDELVNWSMVHPMMSDKKERY